MLAYGCVGDVCVCVLMCGGVLGVCVLILTLSSPLPFPRLRMTKMMKMTRVCWRLGRARGMKMWLIYSCRNSRI